MIIMIISYGFSAICYTVYRAGIY